MAESETAPKFAPFFGMVRVSPYSEAATRLAANAVIRVVSLLR